MEAFQSSDSTVHHSGNGIGTTGSPSGLMVYTEVNSRWIKTLSIKINSTQVVEGNMNEPFKK